MIIRSQDKQRLINFGYVDTIYIEDNYVAEQSCKTPVAICARSKGLTQFIFVLGEYKTMDQAIKALDLLQAAAERHHETFSMPQIDEVSV